MADKRKIVSLCLSLALLISFAGCKNKNDTKNEDIENKTSTEITETVESKKENSIVGTWVVEKNEIYDGPLKEVSKEILGTYYPVGAEYVFTDDGVYKSIDNKYITQYKVLSDNKVSCVDLTDGNTYIYDYELDGDTLIWYSCYTDNVNTGHPSATYMKRKG